MSSVKTPYRIKRIDIFPLVQSKELELFAHLIQQPTGLTILKNFGIEVPLEFEVIENTGGQPDEPPDINAFGYGFEHTEFPPNLTIVSKVHLKRGTISLRPPFQLTGKEYGTIRKEMNDPASKTNSSIRPYFRDINKEQKALAEEFRALLESNKTKDKPGNDILLIDQRGEALQDGEVCPAIRSVLSEWKLKYIRLIIMIRAKESIQVWP